MRTFALFLIAAIALFGAGAFALEKPDYKSTNPSRAKQDAGTVCQTLKDGTNKDRTTSKFHGGLVDYCNSWFALKKNKEDQTQAATIHYAAGAMCLTECVGMAPSLGPIKMCQGATMAAKAFNEQKAADAKGSVQGFGAPGACLEPKFFRISERALYVAAFNLVNALAAIAVPEASAADTTGGSEGGSEAGSAGGGDAAGGADKKDSSSACTSAAVNVGMGVQKTMAAENAKKQADAVGENIEEMATWPEPDSGVVINLNTNKKGNSTPSSRQSPEDVSAFFTNAKSRCKSGDEVADRLCMAALEDLSGKGNGGFSNLLKDRSGLSMEDIKKLQQSGKSGGEISGAIGNATGANGSSAGINALAEAKKLAEKSHAGEESKLAGYSGGGSNSGYGGESLDPLAGLGDGGPVGDSSEAMRFLAKENESSSFQAGQFSSQQVSPLFVAVTNRYRAKIKANDLPNE